MRVVSAQALTTEMAEGTIPGITATSRVEEVPLGNWKGLFVEEGELRESGITPIKEEGISGLVPSKRSGEERVWTEQFQVPWTVGKWLWSPGSWVDY